MNAILIKFRILVFLIMLFSSCAKGQNLRFIYIQTENKLPFYVKMDKKYLSSSMSGYIIIGKLIEGAYPLTIGSPKNEWPELNVTLNVKDINTGYLLKKTQDKNWSLVNLQTTASIAAEKQPVPNKKEEIFLNGDEFSRILAQVVNDSSIAKVTPVKKNTATVVVTAPATINAEISEVIEKLTPEPPKAPKRNSQITKLNHDSTSAGFLVAYLDRSDAANDTVKLFIPVNQSITTVTNQKKITAKADPRFINIELQNPNVKADSGEQKKAGLIITEKKNVTNKALDENADTKVAEANSNKKLINAKCKKTATQSEFLKLRKQMATEENEKNMIRAANKQFIITCFTTEQVKNLGVLFVTEEEKYKFYVNAFPYTIDLNNFGLLENELSDIYYKTRFKAMLSN